jgi:HNH endonuclease
VKFDRETITAELAAKQCKQCGHIGAGMTLTFTEGPHFARLNCNQCGAFLEWVSMPDAAPKRDRRKSRKKLPDLGDRCEICLRHRDELPSPEKLEVHHVLEVSADEGTDDLGNLRVYCSACHAMVSWIRTYFGHYTPESTISDADLVEGV